MPSIRLTQEAAQDLDDIFAYTLEVYGLPQARRYQRRLFKAFEVLERFPQAGAERDDIRPGLRCLVHESHSIYYRVENDDVLVGRIIAPRRGPFDATG